MPTHATGSPPTKRPTAKRKASQANTLLAQFMAAEDDGSLAQRVREVVAGTTAARRPKPAKPRPDMAPARGSGPPPSPARRG